MSYIYLASPYSHPDPEVRERRFEAACRAAGRLMLKGKVVFSPVAHSHPIERIGLDRRYGQDFWLRQDIPFLRGAAELCVLKLPGWEQSIGVEAEIQYARLHRIPVTYLEPEDTHERAARS